MPFNDVKIIQCGHEACKRGHSFRPYIRNHHLFHFVVNVTGKFYIRKKEYILKDSDMFYIPPGEVTFYRADMQNPWNYIWIGLSGVNLSGINTNIHEKITVSLVKYIGIDICNFEKTML